MAWLNTANILPRDIRRVWYLDATNGQQVLLDGPVAGTFAYQITSSGYGPTAYFESSQYGVPAESAAYRGDWTYEGFVYMNSAANSLVFNAGGWSGQTTEDKNLLAAIVLRNQKIEVWWETGSNTTVTPSAQSAVMSLTAWHHIAVVKDSVAKTLAFYVDGAPSGTATFSANPTGGDTASTGECRMAFGGYLNGWTLPNARIACATFSTAKRDAAWMAASYAHLSTDATLPTDESTWMQVGPYLRSDLEQRAAVAVDVAHASAYDEGFDGGYAAGLAAGAPPTPPEPPTPVPLPVTFTDPEYVDHVAVALSRLPQQFRGDPWRGW